MIVINILTGPYAGTEGKFRGRVDVDSVQEVDPIAVLNGFLHYGWDWKIDFSQATPQEEFEWSRANLVVCVLRALADGRPVRFEDKVFASDGTPADIRRVAGEIEDAVTSSGRMVRVEADNDHELVIGVGGWEQ